MPGETIDFSQESTDENRAERTVSPELLADLAERFHECRGFFTKIAMRHVKNLHDAQDVVSNAWIRVQNYAATYDPSRKFLPWAAVIVTNAAKSFVATKYGLRRATTGMHEVPFTDFYIHSNGKPLNIEMKPEQVTESRITPELMIQVQVKVDAVLGQMDPKVRKMMRRYLNGEAMKHIVEGTGLTESTGSVYAHRFRKKMREVIAGDEELFAELNDKN